MRTNLSSSSAPQSEPLLSEVSHNSDPSNNNSNTGMVVSVSFVVAVAIAVLPMLFFGFHTGVLNAPESVIFPGHSVFSWSLAVSAFCVGGFGGSATAGRYADRFGRRHSLLLILTLNAIFGLLHALAPGMAILILARIGVGLAGGASTVLTPMYLSEISPLHMKGSIGTLTQLSCVIGILVSILYALPLCTPHLWRWIFVPLPIISMAGIALGHCYLPESPRWLLLNHYNTHADDARDIIRRFRNLRENEDEEAVEMEVLLMTRNNANSNRNGSSSSSIRDEEGTSEPQLQLSYDGTDDGNQMSIPQEAVTPMTFQEFCADPSNRTPLVASILFPVAQQLSGINAVFYYSTLFFNGVIANPKVGTCVAFAVNVVATLVALILMDKLGRKTLLSLSAGGMGICCIFLTLSLQGILPPTLTVICVMFYITFFELGLGCIPFFLMTELIQPQFLGTVQSISMASNWLSNFLVGILFPYMDKLLGPYSFVPFGVVLLGTLCYAVLVLPETRGKSLDQVLEEIRATAAQRQHPHHHRVAQVEDEVYDETRRHIS